MLKSLELLSEGQIFPKYFESVITLNRVYDLALSKHSSLEPFHKAGVSAIDLERDDERYLLSGGKNGDISIHDLFNSSADPSYISKVVCKVKSGEQHAHKKMITTVQWYPFDTGMFMTSGMDHVLKLWDTSRMKPVDSISMEHKIETHNMSPISTQHNLIAVGMKSPHIVLVDPRTGSRCHELRGHRVGVSSLKWSPLCEYLLASGGTDNRIFFWDIRSAKGHLQTLDQYNGESIGSNNDLKTAHDGVVNSLKFTPNGLFLVSHGTDGRVRLWDVALCKNSLVNFGTLSTVSAGIPLAIDMCFNGSLTALFVPCDNHVFVYDLFNGCKIKTLIGHFGLVTGCAYRSSTHELYSSGSDRNIIIWTPDKYTDTTKRAPNTSEMDSWSD